MDRPLFRAAFFHPRFWLLWSGLGVLWLVVQLPYKWQLGIGRFLGACMFRVAGERRRIAARNLELCFPEKNAGERERLLKENFASTGIAFFVPAISSHLYLVSGDTQSNRARKTRSDAQYAPYRFPQDR